MTCNWVAAGLFEKGSISTSLEGGNSLPPIQEAIIGPSYPGISSLHFLTNVVKKLVRLQLQRSLRKSIIWTLFSQIVDPNTVLRWLWLHWSTPYGEVELGCYHNDFQNHQSFFWTDLQAVLVILLLSLWLIPVSVSWRERLNLKLLMCGLLQM